MSMAVHPRSYPELNRSFFSRFAGYSVYKPQFVFVVRHKSADIVFYGKSDFVGSFIVSVKHNLFRLYSGF